MILTHYLLSNPIRFDDCLVQRLVVENPGFMGRLLSELNSQIEGYDGNFILSDARKEYALSQSVHVVIDPFSLKLSSKDVISALNKKMLQKMEGESAFLKIRGAMSALSTLVTDVASDLEPSLDVGELNSQSLLKAMSIDISDADTLAERICESVRLKSQYSGCKLSVLVNMGLYLSKEEYDGCVSQLMYMNTPVLLIESSFTQDGLESTIVDADCCEIRIAARDDVEF